MIAMRTSGADPEENHPEGVGRQEKAERRPAAMHTRAAYLHPRKERLRADREGIRWIDYFDSEILQLKNALPTAEGAIMLAIQNTAFTLFGSRCLIIGFGRVGKILADRLKGFGCDITVSARKSSDFAHINALNMTCAHTSLLNENPLDYDIIFNTVDFPVLNENSLKNSKCKCIIDLSSKGGFNLEYAKSLNITAIKAPSLPALTAPETAGEFLAQTILDSINSQE